MVIGGFFVKDSSINKEKKISRADFLKWGAGSLCGLAVFAVAGCRNNALAEKPNVPMPQVYNFIGDPKTKIYHKLNCRLAPNKTKGVFFDSPIAAKNSGFRPCLACKPLDP